MTSPPPAAPRGRPGSHARPRAGSPVGSVLTRIIRTDELPAGVDALASADGKTIIVRASLDQAGRRRAMREVLASIRRFPRLALYPAISLAAIRTMLRRLAGTLSEASQAIQQAAAAAGDHVSGLGMAVTAAAGTVAVVTVVVATSAPGAGAGAGAGAGGGPGATAAAAGAGHPKAVRKKLPARPLSYLGVYEDGVPGSFSGVTQFALSVGATPNIALYYSSWNEEFKTVFAQDAYAADVIPAVQIEPFGVSLAAVAAGTYDAYLRSYASQVRDFGQAVIIGFGHEPNGSWYPWGAGRVPPAIWIAAWRHIVTVFRSEGADNVTWLWTVNAQGPGTAPARAWWPGPGYVTWVGVDGYYAHPGATFRTVFGSVLSDVRGLGKPIIISETAVGPGDRHQAAGIRNLFQGLRASRQLLGLIWFDKAQDHGPYRQDWRLEGHAALIRAFRSASGYLSS
jgi:mannan endo-1,4-beta-mannosidase